MWDISKLLQDKLYTDFPGGHQLSLTKYFGDVFHKFHWQNMVAKIWQIACEFREFFAMATSK